MTNRPRDIAQWLRQQLAIAGAHGFAVGLSGGVDSAVVARLCETAAPGKVVAVIMPCHSDPSDAADARTVAEHFGLRAVLIDLSPTYDRLLEDIGAAMQEMPEAVSAGPAGDTGDRDARTAARANLKARLRMSTLYTVAGSLGYLVAGTGNRSELMLGYFTKYGDGGVDVLPIGMLLKGEVQSLARALDVPAAIIDKAPTAGLWPGQTDEGEMGFRYSDLERYVTEGPDAISPALAMRIERLVRTSEHKRALPPIPDAD